MVCCTTAKRGWCCLQQAVSRQMEPSLGVLECEAWLVQDGGLVSCNLGYGSCRRGGFCEERTTGEDDGKGRST